VAGRGITSKVLGFRLVEFAATNGILTYGVGASSSYTDANQTEKYRLFDIHVISAESAAQQITIS
jgi:hypothetical protein